METEHATLEKVFIFGSLLIYKHARWVKAINVISWRKVDQPLQLELVHSLISSYELPACW
jgi:hypothetical protein